VINTKFPGAVAIAASQGFLAVALGAFGAHGLRGRLDTDAMAVWQTAVQYHFYHALALFALALYWHGRPLPGWWQLGFVGFLAGILFFSGSLYWLAWGGPRWLGPVTPLGGLCFIAAWFCLAVGAVK